MLKNKEEYGLQKIEIWNVWEELKEFGDHYFENPSIIFIWNFFLIFISLLYYIILYLFFELKIACISIQIPRNA